MPDDLEVELKFLAETDAPLRALEGAQRLGSAHLGQPDTFDELDRYLDTGDGRLAAEGWACRLRLRHGEWLVSLKGARRAAARPDSVLHHRPELEGPASDQLDPAGWPASRARELLLAVAAGRPLAERLRLAQVRTEREVGVQGRPAGTLSLDRVTVLRDARQLGDLRAVELELHNADEALAEPLAEALRAIPGLVPDQLSKLEHALRMLESDPTASAVAEGEP